MRPPVRADEHAVHDRGTRPPRPDGGTGRGGRRAHGLQVKAPPAPATGSVHSGPSAVLASGRVTKASGPAWCSPLNGVTPVNPQGCASVGLLNQKPRWNVLVGARPTSLSTPKIWSRRTVRILARPEPSECTCRSDWYHASPTLGLASGAPVAV